MDPFRPHARATRAVRRLPKRGTSLVEVMIAATIFTMLAMSGTAMFLQNQRTAVTYRYRTQATNTALNMLEQLRLKNYEELKTLRAACLASPTTDHTTMILVADPAYVPPTPDPYASLNLPPGLHPLELKVNVNDGTVIKDAYTLLDLPMETGANAVKLKTRYWLTLKYNESMGTDIVQAMELALVYQWRAASSTNWQENTIRLVVTNPQAVKAIIAPTS